MSTPRDHHHLRLVFAMVLACLAGTVGCHDTSHYWVLTDIGVSLPPITGKERPRDRAGGPAELLQVAPGGGQTLLVAADLHDNPEVRDDESGRTFVVVLDGPPAKGTYEVTPENGRIILHSVWLPPRTPYAGIEGGVKIHSVSKEGKVLAYCVLRNLVPERRVDSHVLRGWYRFEPPAAEDDVHLRQAAIRVCASQPAEEATP